MDPTGWTATGVAAVEGLAIVGLIVRRRQVERGRRLRVTIDYTGRDTLDETDTVPDDVTVADDVTPDV